MALSGTTNKITYTAIQGQTQFNVPSSIPFFDATTIDIENKKFGDIKVTKETVAGDLIQLTPNANPTNNIEFKINATNSDPAQGCVVTLGAGSDFGDKYTIERDVAYTQEYDLQEGATIDPTALNKALDRVVAQNQLQNDGLTRTITFPVTDLDSITYTVNSSATNRANKVLGFDNNGSITPLSLSNTNLIGVDNNAGLEFINAEREVVTAYNHWNFTGDGVNVSFLLNDNTSTDPYAYIVTIDGITQTPVTSYEITDNNFIRFTSPPPSNTLIFILNISVNLQLTGD